MWDSYLKHIKSMIKTLHGLSPSQQPYPIWNGKYLRPSLKKVLECPGFGSSLSSCCFRQDEGLQVLPEDVGHGKGAKGWDHQRPAQDEAGEDQGLSRTCFTCLAHTCLLPVPPVGAVYRPLQDSVQHVQRGGRRAALVSFHRHSGEPSAPDRWSWQEVSQWQQEDVWCRCSGSSHCSPGRGGPRWARVRWVSGVSGGSSATSIHWAGRRGRLRRASAGCWGGAAAGQRAWRWLVSHFWAGAGYAADGATTCWLFWEKAGHPEQGGSM